MDQAFLPSHYSWLYLPTAIILGVLHGLEPGHSKTMMASFIIAIHGTVKQAFLLGLAATLSHTAIIWILAALALYFKGSLTAESVQPYLEIASALIVFGLAGWTAWRTWKSTHHPLSQARENDHARPHQHTASHVHEHGEAHHHHLSHDSNAPETSLGLIESADDHERWHAGQIKSQFKSGSATNSQILLFGLTGGLMPCPAAFTVLLLCLQGGQVFLGFSIVLAFSLGLAITLVGVGCAAAIGARYATAKFSSLGRLAANAPFLSSAVLIVLGIYMLIKGFSALGTGQ